jgi:hypothetical protein
LKILGSPIRLADVLLTLHLLNNNGSYVVSDVGIFAHFKAEGARIDSALKVFECEWNLRADDLEHQSQGTINFIWELLK